MNKYDSEIIESQLLKENFIKTNDVSEADVIILNTCAVREHSSHKAISTMGKYLQLKNKNKNLICAFIGCAAQAEKLNILKSLPDLDIILGPQDIYEFYNILNKILKEKKTPPITKFSEQQKSEFYHRPHNRNNKYQAFVSIMTGCNNFCSYCIVPYTRGREQSRKSSDILSEINFLLKDGCKDITLLGQNVNSFGKDLVNEISFTELLKRIDNVGDNFWLRYITSHPKDISDDLIFAYKNFKNVVNHLHLPVQSGSNKILKFMNRNYTIDDYKKKIDALRKIRENIYLTTDIIVGFPGETETDFNYTINAIDDIKFDFAFVFKYSDRKKTKASFFPEKVSQQDIETRHQILLNKILNLSFESNKKFLNKNVKVLVDKESPKNEKYLSCRTEENKVVIIKGDKNLIGTFVNVRINAVKSYTLWGEIVNDDELKL